jgi:hypothetical protein
VERSDCPTTAPIGTDRVIGAVSTLGRRHCIDLSARKLLARGPKCSHRVRESDNAAAVGAQWAALAAALRNQRKVLIYHLENHYSCVYGAREWAAVGNVRDGVQQERVIRQVLVGKPGQKPNRWLAFEDVRACVLGWAGYAVIEVIIM